MDENKIEKGMHVIIANDISKTKGLYRTTETMKLMRGKEFVVSKIKKEYNLVTAYVGGFLWHPHDLIEVSIKPEPKIFHFDINELNI